LTAKAATYKQKQNCLEDFFDVFHEMVVEKKLFEDKYKS